MRHTARRDEEAARADAMLCAFDVHEELALEHVDRLVLVRMGVHRRRLSALHAVLQHEERAACLRGGGLPRERPAAGKPHLLALTGLSDDANAPTVEQAAERAAVSRTTAYRYFPNQRALLLASYPELDMPSLLDPDAPADPGARLELVTQSIARQLLEHEPELRAMLRLSLEMPPPDKDTLPLRQGRVIGWIEDALAPLRESLPAAELRRLALAIRATLGIEPLIWLTDVAGLSRYEAADLMRASARTLLQATLAEAADSSVR